jgi:hypothetical protein
VVVILDCVARNAAHDLEMAWDWSFELQPVQSGIYTWVVRFTDKFTIKSFKYEGH